MKKQSQDFIVFQNIQLGSSQFLLTLQAETALPNIVPGQFVQVKVEGVSQLLLRRPFSIHFVDTSKGQIDLLIRKVGPGTHQLAKLKPGDSLPIIYPLGRGFSMQQVMRPLLIGGGCGVAPLLFLAQELFKQGAQSQIIMGGKTRDDLVEVERYEKFAEVFLTTEDGSLGHHGRVTDHPILLEPKKWDMLYCCGPEPMMKAVAAYSGTLPCEVSLEHGMACGIGTCLCCVTPTQNGHECVCTHGPVFNTKYLLW